MDKVPTFFHIEKSTSPDASISISWPKNRNSAYKNSPFDLCHIPVIFLTAKNDLESKINGLKIGAEAYVEKPFSPEDVKGLVKKALHHTTDKGGNASICFGKDRILYPVKIEEILYIESVKQTVYVHQKDGQTLSFPYLTCQKILDRADTDCLFQCARGVIINKDYVVNIDISNKYITLKGVAEKIEIGISFKKKVLEEFLG